MTAESEALELVRRRYEHAADTFAAEAKILGEDMSATIVISALLSVARETARDAGFAPCQYQMFLIEELTLLNRIRRLSAEPGQ